MINQRIAQLRELMKARNLDAYIVTGTDPHQSEYALLRWRTREWITGFSGSAGTVVITLESAGLWTDFRYYIQGAEELAGTEVDLHRSGEPGVKNYQDWLAETLRGGDVVAVNAETMAMATFRSLEKQLSAHAIELKADDDLLNLLWDDRPAISSVAVSDYAIRYAGKSREDKVTAVRNELTKKGASHHLISATDEIAWLLNIRGRDIDYTPVCASHLLVGPERCTWFVHPDKVSNELVGDLKTAGITIADYSAPVDSLKNLPGDASLLVDPAKVGHRLVAAIPETCRIIDGLSPVAMMKCVKNSVEIQGMRSANLRDGAAMANFLHWLDTHVPQGGVTELSVADKLVEFRSAEDLFIEPSFSSIAGYKEHGALCHYSADETSSYELKPESFFLIDSGGQYWDGTTDITRTIPLGEVTDQQKNDFTLVLKCHIQLATAIFPEGTSGGQLELLGKNAMWQVGSTYSHGPGHGLGVCLGVHEGPAGFGRGNSTPLKVGMILTNEPGIYREGHYGIRIENTITVTEAFKNDFGTFFGFETISYCPIDTRAVKPELLSECETDWLNTFHQNTFDKISPLVKPDVAHWLEDRCKPI